VCCGFVGVSSRSRVFFFFFFFFVLCTQADIIYKYVLRQSPTSTYIDTSMQETAKYLLYRLSSRNLKVSIVIYNSGRGDGRLEQLLRRFRSRLLATGCSGPLHSSKLGGDKGAGGGLGPLSAPAGRS